MEGRHICHTLPVMKVKLVSGSNMCSIKEGGGISVAVNFVWGISRVKLAEKFPPRIPGLRWGLVEVFGGFQVNRQAPTPQGVGCKQLMPIKRKEQGPGAVLHGIRLPLPGCKSKVGTYWKQHKTTWRNRACEKVRRHSRHPHQQRRSDAIKIGTNCINVHPTDRNTCLDICLQPLLAKKKKINASNLYPHTCSGSNM